jgi:hypothetical protein
VTSNYVPKVSQKLPDVTLYEGEIVEDVFDLDDYFTDPDDNSIYFSYGETHVDVFIDTDHTVDISSPGEWFGTDTVTFRATDPSSAIAEDTIRVIVLPVNDPPRISGVPDLVVHYDQEYTFDLFYYITDVDNETSDLRLIFMDAVSKLPMDGVWAESGDNLVMHLLFGVEWLNKDIPVRITVSDGISSSFQDITVTVSDDWPPEIIKQLPDRYFHEDKTLYNAFSPYTLNDYFYDKDEEILFFTYGHDYINITINNDGSVDLSAPKDWFGEEYVTFRATDTKGALVESRILITVLPVNDAPVISEIPTLYIQTGLENFDLSPYISDVDSELLTVDVDSEEADLMVFVNGMDLVLISEKGLNTTLTITVSDNEDLATGYMMVVIEGEAEEETDDLNVYQILFILVVILVIILILIFMFVYLRGFFTVEELYLVYEDGRLIKHVQRGIPSVEGDEEIISGMFTAIQDLIDDTFTKGSGDIKRKKLEFEGKHILIEKGRKIYLTLIVSGRPGKLLEGRMRSTVDAIEKEYRQFRDWDGRRHMLKNIEKHFEKFIKVEKGKVAEGKTEDPRTQQPPKIEESALDLVEEELGEGISVFQDLEEMDMSGSPTEEEGDMPAPDLEDAPDEEIEADLEDLLEEDWGEDDVDDKPPEAG